MGERLIRAVTMATALLAMITLITTTAQAQDTYAAKNPVLAAACKTCPWGALGEIVKDQMAFYGYDVEMCYNCNLAHGPRIVGERRVAPPLNERNAQLGVTTRPKRPADFGITSVQLLYDAVNGTGRYTEDPQKNLRLIAMIENPNYLVVAVKAESGITDLTQLTGKPGLKIMAGPENEMNEPILAHYGLEKEKVEASGGEFLSPGAIDKRDDFDVIMHGGLLGNNPEANVWYEMSQRHNLRFLQLDDALLDKLAEEFHLERVDLPIGYFRGLDRPIPTVVRPGQVVFGRDDMPDSFAYDVAKAINEKRELLKYALIHFTYDSRTVWKTRNIKLHPGAERYYREAGFIQ